ncbi:MAG TPA: ORF6N domain-containing protein [Puia sp.]|jgi:hypothetical protein
MLDFDLAALYEVETRIFNQTVKRNVESFPEDFMFQLTRDEWQKMSSQFVITYSGNDKNQQSKSFRKYRSKSYLPFAFTKHGVTMQASVLKSPKREK